MYSEKQRSVMLPVLKPPSVNISFSNLTYTVSTGSIFKGEKKTVLKGVSGTFKAGELTAIMGPSGAGKSTLLNILTGYHVKGVSGTVKTNGKAIQPGKDETRKQSSYILQDDFLNENFTVLETMNMAADLKIGIGLNEKAKGFLVEDILDTLGMGNTRLTPCSELSGGQKKRLSIALELLDNPPVVYLDEPTTGLDSSSTSQLIKLLKRLASTGKTVVLTMHQPSAAIFEQFDHVYFVSKGLCTYQGSSSNLVPYLKSAGLSCPMYHNPVDFMIEVLTGDHGDMDERLANAAKDPTWRENSPPVEDKKEIISTNGKLDSQTINGTDRTLVLISPPSEWRRFQILIKKNVTLLHRDWTIVYLKALLHLFVGILCGLLFQDIGQDASKSISNVSFFLVCVVYETYTSLMPAALKFHTDINVLKKEQFNNWYHLRTYYCALLIVNVPCQMFFSLLFMTTVYYLTGQIFEAERFLKFVIIGLLTIIVSECKGLSFGTFGNVITGIFWASIVIAIEILLCGFLAILTYMPKPLYYISYANYLRYSLQALTITAYGYDRQPLDCPGTELYCHYKYPETILADIGMTDVSYWADVAALVGFFFMYASASYYFLYVKVKSR